MPAAYDDVADWCATWVRTDAVHELGDGPAPDVLAVAAHRPGDGAAAGALR